MKIVLVTQHYPPDNSTTSTLLRAIAEWLAAEFEVVVLSGTPGSTACADGKSPVVFEIKNREPRKGAIWRRGFAMALFGLRAFRSVIKNAQREDCVFVVTAPFVLPFAAVLAARLRSARSVLVLHDLYPDVLVKAGIVSKSSLVVSVLRHLNKWMFRNLDSIVTVGRDMDRALLAYKGVTRTKIEFISNWPTLAPGYQSVDEANLFRRKVSAHFVVGLSGNLGFTHDPATVLEAARQLANEREVGFLLSGWGVGWEQLKSKVLEYNLTNVTIVERVPEQDLRALLTAADAWVIPYRKDMSGISVPSRLYNILAVGRPVVALAESDAEHSLVLTDHDIGWVVPPENPTALAELIRVICREPNAVGVKGVRAAATVAKMYSPELSAAKYRQLARRVLLNKRE